MFLSGALRLHSHALGWDIVRVPANILWSVANIVLALVGTIAHAVGMKKVSERIKRIPPGLETDMDRQVSWLTVTELLRLPHKQGGRQSDQDALMEEILTEPALRNLLNAQLGQMGEASTEPRFRKLLDAKLTEYAATRTGAADLAGNVLLLLSSKAVLGRASFGTLSAGSAVSATIANSVAASNFWLGSTAGSYYYALFPVAASTRLVLAATASIAIVLAVISTFVGIVTDPLQSVLGLHHKRLRKFIRAVRADLRGHGPADFQLREKYVGRLLDVVDMLDVAVRLARAR